MVEAKNNRQMRVPESERAANISLLSFRFSFFLLLLLLLELRNGLSLLVVSYRKIANSGRMAV